MQTLNFRCLLSGLVLAIGISFVFSCRSNNADHQKKVASGTQRGAIDITMTDIENRDYYDVNDIFDSISYIPLQTTKESMFSSIDQLEVTDKYFFILDKASRAILSFEKNGNFRFKIKSDAVNDLAIDETNQRFVFQNIQKAKSYTYDFNGKLLNTKTPHFNHAGQVFFGPNQIAYYRYFTPGNGEKFKPANVLIADSSEMVKKGLLPYDTTAIAVAEIASPGKPFYKSNNNVYYVEPCENRIYYNLTNDTSPDYFAINLPEKYRLPDDYLTSNKYRGKRKQYITNNPNEVYLIQSVYVIDSLMSFEISGHEWNDIFVYDMKKKKLISTYNFLTGPKNSHLPPGIHFLAADSNSFYRTASARQLFNAHQARLSQSNLATLPKAMQSFYQTQNNLSNPVVIQLYPKKDLSGLKIKKV